jgi:DNA adenine methylase
MPIDMLLATDRPLVRPPLKWAGGKRWQIPRLEPFWSLHRHRRIVEPFCGGLAVALGLRPERALLNDANPHLINFYRWLQRGLHTSVTMENAEASYYRHRSGFNQLIERGDHDTAEAAALFYYLNRTGYNGLCRFNSSGAFNVPFGRYRTIHYTADFGQYREALAGWTFTHGDFERIQLQPDDFVYADPPYDVEFTEYAQGGFSWIDQERTATWLAAHPGPVILVNQATDRVRRLYGALDYNLQEFDAPRRISCNGDRRPAREVLATRNL